MSPVAVVILTKACPGRLGEVLAAARVLAPERLLVLAAGGRPLVEGEQIPVFSYDPPLGAGGGLLRARTALEGFEGTLLILAADVGGLPRLLERHDAEGNACTLLAADLAEGEGLGRVVRDRMGRVVGLECEADPPPGLRVAALAIDGDRLFDLLTASGEGCAVADAVAVLYQQGGLIGAVVEPPASQQEPCRWCASPLRVGPESGLLQVGRFAALAVDRPGYNSGQLVCVPKRHVTSLLSLTPEELAEIGDLVREGEGRLRRVYRPDGLNLALGSGLAEHLELKVIPRWTGDLNFLPFAGGMKTVPESPAEAWRRLEEVRP